VTQLDPESVEDRTAHLLVALEHRTVLGQATGILMERYQLDAGTAFRVLLRTSSERNRKVYDIAQQLVAEGHAEDL
jgi:AmiR/NasT family two-component response regulator